MNTMCVDRTCSYLYAADNCTKTLCVYDLQKKQIACKEELPSNPNDFIVDFSNNLLTLMRGNLFSIYSNGAIHGSCSMDLVRSATLKDVPTEFRRHLTLIKSESGVHPAVLVCTAQGKTAKIDYASLSKC